MGNVSIPNLVEKVIEVAPYLVGGYLVWMIIKAPKSGVSKKDFESGKVDKWGNPIS